MRNIFLNSWGGLRSGWLLLVIALSTLAAVAILFIAIIFCINKAAQKECDVYSEVTLRQTEFRFMECYVFTPKGWIPRSELEKRAVTNE